MRRFLFLLVLALGLPAAAQAHKLRVFAAFADGEIAGYAFFIGGGRPQNVPVTITDAAGTLVSEARTDDQGGFRWAITAPGTYVVTVNAQDGHAATAEVTAGVAAENAGEAPSPAPSAASDAPPAPAPAGLAAIEAAVAAAVQREILPLREEIAAMDNRLRITDVISGVFLLIGLAGILIWLKSRPGPRA